jgi:hypothetical protein
MRRLELLALNWANFNRTLYIPEVLCKIIDRHCYPALTNQSHL